MNILYQNDISIQTTGRACFECTQAVNKAILESGIAKGLCHVFIQHTSASLLISENADPSVLRDLETFMSNLVVDGDPNYEHHFEGPDDMPSHIRSVLTQTAVTIPVREGALALGTWQGLFLWEHRHRGHQRHLIVSVYGE